MSGKKERFGLIVYIKKKKKKKSFLEDDEIKMPLQLPKILGSLRAQKQRESY
jgi:hypothetical protein